jgi:hypothetical protein
MTRNIAIRLVVVALLGFAAPLMACPSKEKSPVEKLSESAQDALNMREHEKLKDAGEDAQDAVEGAGAAVKEEAESVGD